MDVCRYLPVEVLEVIFSYLSAEDLAKCSEVSVIWREAANNRNLWRNICEESSLGDLWELRDFESSFEDPSLHFHLPLLSDRLSPMSKWKIYYCQQKYVDYNWRRGRNAKHFIKDYGYSLNRSNPKQCALVYPIVDDNRIKSGNIEIQVMRIDCKPKLVYQHELSPSDDLDTFMIEGNTISFIFGRKLKTFIYQNNEFNMVHEYDLGPENKLNDNAFKICRELDNILHYFIDTTSSYLVTACEAYFHVWDRNTGYELGFVNCPTNKSGMYSFCLQGGCIYFVTCTSTNHTKLYELYEYYIVEKTLNLVDTIYADLLRDILSNELYLIVSTRMVLDNYNEAVLFYNRSSKKRVNEITDIEEIDDHSIHKNLLFLMIKFEVQIMRIPSCTLETKFKLPYSKTNFIKMHNVGQNLLIISVGTKHVDVWDWKKGVLCSSINCPGRLVWCDPIRLILQRWLSCNESELTVIGLW